MERRKFEVLLATFVVQYLLYRVYLNRVFSHCVFLSRPQIFQSVKSCCNTMPCTVYLLSVQDQDQMYCPVE